MKSRRYDKPRSRLSVYALLFILIVSVPVLSLAQIACNGLSGAIEPDLPADTSEPAPENDTPSSTVNPNLPENAEQTPEEKLRVEEERRAEYQAEVQSFLTLTCITRETGTVYNPYEDAYTALYRSDPALINSCAEEAGLEEGKIKMLELFQEVAYRTVSRAFLTCITRETETVYSFYEDAQRALISDPALIESCIYEGVLEYSGKSSETFENLAETIKELQERVESRAEYQTAEQIFLTCTTRETGAVYSSIKDARNVPLWRDRVVTITCADEAGLWESVRTGVNAVLTEWRTSSPEKFTFYEESWLWSEMELDFYSFSNSRGAYLFSLYIPRSNKYPSTIEEFRKRRGVFQNIAEPLRELQMRVEIRAEHQIVAQPFLTCITRKTETVYSSYENARSLFWSYPRLIDSCTEEALRKWREAFQNVAETIEALEARVENSAEYQTAIQPFLTCITRETETVYSSYEDVHTALFRSDRALINSCAEAAGLWDVARTGVIAVLTEWQTSSPEKFTLYEEAGLWCSFANSSGAKLFSLYYVEESKIAPTPPCIGSIWTSTVTSGNESGENEYGYSGNYLGSISDDTFVHNGATYTIHYLIWDETAPEEIEFKLRECLPISAIQSITIGGRIYMAPDSQWEPDGYCRDNPTHRQWFKFKSDATSNPLPSGRSVTFTINFASFSSASQSSSRGVSWAAIINSERESGDGEYGYEYDNFGSISDNTFLHNGTTYTIENLIWDDSAEKIEFSLLWCLPTSAIQSITIGGRIYTAPDSQRETDSYCLDNPTSSQKFEWYETSNPLRAGRNVVIFINFSQ